MKQVPLTPEQKQERIAAISKWGFLHVRDMVFTKKGKTYDLSAADLNRLDYIEAKGSFVI